MTDQLSFRSVSKRFGGVQALRDVSFDVALGTIHAVVGENGAGKSTLMNVLAGVVRPDAGSVHVAGTELSLGSSQAPRALGIEVVYQELSLFPDLTVAQNVHIGREPRNRIGLVAHRTMVAEARAALASLGASIDPTAHAGELSIGEQQLVEIARALSHRARIVVLDEPNSALTVTETEVLLATLKRLRDDGVTLLLVSHRLDEVFQVADTITVLRNGGHVATVPAAATTTSAVVEMMVGRPPVRSAGRGAAPAGDRSRLVVERLTREPRFRSVSFSLSGGEIVGLAGLEGCGANDVLETLFGVHVPDTGTVTIDGRRVRLRSPAQALGQAIGFIPRDRRSEGLVMDLNVENNLALSSLDELRSGLLVSGRKKASLARRIISDLAIKVTGGTQSVLGLSGGNQQKVVVGRWLATNPQLLLMNDPTRGIDVGAKAEIHALVHRLSEQGMAIVMTSSEFEEIVELAHRVLVFYRGDVVGQIDTSAPDAGERMIALATTGAPNGARPAMHEAGQ